MATYDFEVKQGEASTRVAEWNEPDGSDVELDDYTAKLTIRDRRNDTATELDTLAIDDGLSIAEDDGEVTLSIDGDRAALWDWRFGFYDLLVWVDGDPMTDTYLVEGVIRVRPRITRREEAS